MIRKKFLDESFLLDSYISAELYEDYAKDKPIFDYHNHLSPKDIAKNRQFENIVDLWLEGDHYKWRAMRTAGIPERQITGEVDPFEKFLAWAKTVPLTLRNPLYHWTHLELNRYFGIDILLNEQTAKEIYEECNEQLKKEENRVLGLLSQSKVVALCTTDDPVDDLQYHKLAKNNTEGIVILPTFRADNAFNAEDTIEYNLYIDKLGSVVGFSIQTYEDLTKALENRHVYFDSIGARVSDSGIEQPFAMETNTSNLDKIFKKVRSGEKLSINECHQLRFALLIHISKLNHKRNWVQQFHVGPIRNNNQALLKLVGRDAGCDSIGDYSSAQFLSTLLGRLSESNQLAKTILYNINPADNDMFATMTGNFQDGSVPAKIQFGAAWWFNDQKLGIINQINSLSNMGLLSLSVGMLTDSRSFLSFSRHEYFRRILCNLFANDIINGELPNDMKMIGEVIENICFKNAKNYFSGISVPLLLE